MKKCHRQFHEIRPRGRASRHAAALLATLAILANARGTLVATDGAVPALMNAGGILEDPAQYIIGVEPSYTLSFASTIQLGSDTATSSFNSLTIQNGAALLATDFSAGSIIGLGLASNATSGSNNRATVTGNGSQWGGDGNTTLTVGQLGSNNSLTIEAGGKASSTFGVIGTGSTGNAVLGSGNNAKVTGASSAWTIFDGLQIGRYGSGNMFTIEAGGNVNDHHATIGAGDTANVALGNGNSVKVTGAASLWTNRASLIIGQLGSSNTLTIEAGGKVTSGDSYIGQGDMSGAGTSNNNGVTVTGRGSQWTLGTLFIGYNGSNNTLTIADQGLVSLTGLAISVFGRAGNRIQLNDGYLAWTGDHTSSLTTFVNSGKIRYWNGSAYVIATAADLSNGNLTLAYYATGAEATTFTGGLYTFTAATTILTTIPEPATLASLALAALLGGVIFLCRRKHPV